jgi:2-oxoglutarate ferredoxin oxidoreductase subunit delta
VLGIIAASSQGPSKADSIFYEEGVFKVAKGRVIIEANKCKACTLCVKFCMKEVLQLSTGALNSLGFHPVEVVKPEECTGCTFCGLMCPDVVITVKKE